MKSLWKRSFKPLVTDTPKDIVQYQCASKEDFEATLEKIINSDKVDKEREYV